MSNPHESPRIKLRHRGTFQGQDSVIGVLWYRKARCKIGKEIASNCFVISDYGKASANISDIRKPFVTVSKGQ